MRVLQQLVKQQGELVQLAARALSTSAASGAADVAVASSSSPFLRFSNPYPQALDHTPLLSTIPETQVSRAPAGCWMGHLAAPENSLGGEQGSSGTGAEAGLGQSSTEMPSTAAARSGSCEAAAGGQAGASW